MIRTLSLILITLVQLTSSDDAKAWGQRGHALITQAAVRIVLDRHPDEPRLREWLAKQNFALSYLSNVPDTAWRDDPGIKELNAPTHYLSCEYVINGFDATVASFPHSWQEVKARVAAQCEEDGQNSQCPPGRDDRERLSEVGSAPWRVAQLVSALKEQFRLVRLAESTASRSRADDARQALVLAGLISHFVGDLGNPLHTTRNYDGEEQGRDGLHVYFETNIVNALPPDLEDKIVRYALERNPLARFTRATPDGRNVSIHQKSLLLGLALTAESYNSVPALLAIDRDHSLLTNTPAKHSEGFRRRRPEDAAAGYQDFIVRCLAHAADVVAGLWIEAWEASKPDMAPFQAQSFPLHPDFIPPRYDDGMVEK